ncbi:alpha-ketoglutarate-dependent 2,4-dichlorophenoxyacetate dioxygenase [Cryptococcus neoformans Tu401-1]|nr:alpha-ketoglutarate-dependent 2,4-dichlorophenoxyacetate dioxygenase [Cryptococcus neoformans var. grubii Bt85]OXG14176.1 alpha-ketoglutarate-dependent 2,4-dichlorophenoxyacetate dioxygenase [Cryptococcus neoformans var. grubii Tu401-1]OXM77277.1 alpha-ketoglutarate-dependent 2,4-dichlorophenoxyacetate dioxygenase [Cryptococcus neoformans var. grubii Bt63]
MTISYTPLHPTFVAEASGVDFDNITPEIVEEIKEGLAKYGVLIFRKTGLNDKKHVEMSRIFGELDDVKPYNKLGRINRLAYDELFDVSNVDPEGNIFQPTGQRAIINRGNTVFHCDSSFNPRRAGYVSGESLGNCFDDSSFQSLLLAHELPPAGTGGNTEFADTRTAYDDLPEERREAIKDWVLWHSQHHSRRVANPGEPLLDQEKFLPTSHPFGKHKLVQVHEPSGRTNLYIANHAYKVESLPLEQGQAEIKTLLDHCSSPRYVCSVEWKNDGDLVIWDNTCVMHRAVPGAFEGKYKRDMRRTTVHDSSSYAWGLNTVGDTWRSGLP